MHAGERAHRRHRFHRLALAAPALIFVPLHLVVGWNPIYPAILALGGGAAAAVGCRPDLKTKTLTSAVLFLALYVVLVAGAELSAPGYIERVWNLGAISGIRVWELPLEELLFGLTFGAYWSGLYEHFTWTRGGRRDATGVQDG